MSTTDDGQYREKLTDIQYHVAREKGTEPLFTDSIRNEHEPGVYRCICCDTPLFSSETKYDSGTGWPSFYQPLGGRGRQGGGGPSPRHGSDRGDVREL